MKFSELILRQIIKTAATRCHILKLKCTKLDFGWASAADPAAPLAGFKGPTLRERRMGRKVKGGEGKGE